MALDKAYSRDTLTSHVDAYFEALVHNDPSRLALAPGARFTENGQDIGFGRGLWATATPEPAYHEAVVVADPVLGQVAVLGSVAEAGDPVLIALRLGLEGDLLKEVETIVCRDRDTIFSLEGMARPRPLLEEVLEPAQRTSREVLSGIADLYLDGILTANGGMIPVEDSCIRVENGVQTVLNPDAVGIRAEARDRGTWHLGVAAQVDLGIFHDIEAARDRRVVAMDEERGLVFAIWFFDHAGPVASRGGVSRFRSPNSMLVAEVFALKAGRIREIESVLDVFPYGMSAGWS